jgi:hypothetical protein
MPDARKLTDRMMRLRLWSRRVRLSPLGRDITMVLALKLAALAILWWAFFSHPVARHMVVEAGKIEAHFAPVTASEESSSAVR